MPGCRPTRFGASTGISSATYYKWKAKFDDDRDRMEQQAVEDRAGDNLEQEFGADFGPRQISVSSLSLNEMPATAACQSAVSIG